MENGHQSLVRPGLEQRTLCRVQLCAHLERLGWGSPVLLVCGPYFETQGRDDFSSFIVRERGYNLHGFKEMPGDVDQFSRLQARPRTKQDGLAPLPPWLRSMPSESRDVVLGLLDAWASGFFRAIIAWGVDWFRRFGKEIDAALQADWNTLIRRLEAIG